MPADPAARRRSIVLPAAGLVLCEGLFFLCVHRILHGRSLWEFGPPATWAPAVPVLGALAGLLGSARRPGRAKAVAITRGAFWAAVVLAAGSVIALLLDQGLSGA